MVLQAFSYRSVVVLLECIVEIAILRIRCQDFTEVDNNVTRNIPSELNRSDWNGMIMHYLGLDHIGHKSGPRR